MGGWGKVVIELEKVRRWWSMWNNCLTTSMNLKVKFGYMKMDRINVFTIFVDGAINMVASLRSCGLEFGESDIAKPFNLTKAGWTCLWEFAHLAKFHPIFFWDHNQIIPNVQNN